MQHLHDNGTLDTANVELVVILLLNVSLFFGWAMSSDTDLHYFSYQTLSEQLTDKELEEGRLYPPLSNIREVSLQMAVKVSVKTKRNDCWLFHLYFVNTIVVSQS